MSHTRTIYNIYGVYAGPAPASGYHFIDESGRLNNIVNTLNGSNFNLIKNLQRIQNASYSVNFNQTNIEAIGKKSFISRENINPATVSLNLSYLQNSIINELRLGFYANYMRTGQIPEENGIAFYENNFGVCLLSGFYTRSNERENNNLAWPMKYRDQRNIFIVVKDDDTDLKFSNTYREIDPNAINYSVYGFGNCYLKSYSTSAAVGSIPNCSVSFDCDNMAVFSSGSGAHIPAVNTNRQMYSGTRFAVPTIINESRVSALLPGDISLKFSSFSPETNVLAVDGTGVAGSSRGMSNLGTIFTGINITNYDISFELNRVPYQSFGEKIPHDRYVKFPVVVNCNFGFLHQDSVTGSIIDELNQNNNYDFEIKLKNPRTTNTAIQYNIKKAKLQGLSSSVSIGPNTLYNVSFSTEIDPDDYTKGLYISGLLNNDATTTINTSYLLQEDGFKILQEDDNRIIVSSFDLFY